MKAVAPNQRLDRHDMTDTESCVRCWFALNAEQAAAVRSLEKRAKTMRNFEALSPSSQKVVWVDMGAAMGLQVMVMLYRTQMLHPLAWTMLVELSNNCVALCFCWRALFADRPGGSSRPYRRLVSRGIICSYH